MNKAQYLNRIAFARLIQDANAKRLPLQMLAPGQIAILTSEQIQDGYEWYYDSFFPLFRAENGDIYTISMLSQTISSARFSKHNMMLRSEICFQECNGIFQSEEHGYLIDFVPTHYAIYKEGADE